jgi:hypothetical protein
MTDLVDAAINDHLAAEIAKEVDAMVLFDVFKESGWTLTRVDPWKVTSIKEVEDWIKENCKDSFHRSGNNMLFKSAEDAVWYNLRWL